MMLKLPTIAAALAAGLSAPGLAAEPDLTAIQTVVVIYAENRSFDNLYGTFPGANGLSNAAEAEYVQRDRDGSVMKGLPGIWGGTSAGIAKNTVAAPTPLTQAQTAEYLGGFNHPYPVSALYGQVSAETGSGLNYVNHDLYHRFYENQMQINGGKNDGFAAWADSGGMAMGYFQTSEADLPLWRYARQYVLADNFFQAAFGGSFLNHQYLVCSCAPIYPNNGRNPVEGGKDPLLSALEPDGVTLKVAAKSPASSLEGPPVFQLSGNLTPDFYAVNTMQPPFPPSNNADVTQSKVDALLGTTLPPQANATIGDRLNAAGIDWAWYAGAWNYALTHKPGTNLEGTAIPFFQTHHQPFNYFAAFDPETPEGAANRRAHLRDGGMNGEEFFAAVDAGALPPVTFYKPQGNLNEHAGYTDVSSGDVHIAELLKHLEASPQWPHMLVVVTYDENGGWWDHVVPPKGDRFGPGSRVPALIVSPFARMGTVDHTFYDTTSILRFVSRRWNLPSLPGMDMRDAGLTANGSPRLGDLTQALVLPTLD